MGNLICWCYVDQEQYQLPQHYENKNSQICDSYDQLSLQQQDIQLQLQQDEYSKQQIECSFCNSYLKTLGVKYNKKYKNNNKHPEHQDNFMELHFSVELIGLLNNDTISLIVSTWVQLAVALPKVVQNNYKIGISKQNPEFNLNCEELQTLICLKWCAVDFFYLSLENNHQNDIIRECFQMFKRILHYCIFFNELYLQNCNQKNYKEKIKLYLEFYGYYQKLMQGYSNQYEQLIDEMQLIYQKKFDFQNKDNQYPHFKVVGYMMRFWCQIMLSDQIQEILEESYQQLNQSEDQKLIYEYVVCALDVNLNEDNIHWIGHRSYFQYEKKLLKNGIKKNQEELIKDNNPYHYTNVSETLANKKKLYPSWFYEIEIENIAIQNKIKNLHERLKANTSESSTFIDSYSMNSKNSQNSQNSDSFLSKDAHQEQQRFLRDLFQRNVIQESCDSLDSIENLETIIQELNNNSTISTDDFIINNKEREQKTILQLIEALSELIKIKKKFKQREFRLAQRAKKYKIKLKRNIEWLGFFQKTNFDKIPDSQKQLRQYLKQILNKLENVDNFYKNQLENFL